MARILLLNGPNLNLLGTREPDVYGADTLADIEGRLDRQASALGHELISFQSNAEHDLVAQIQQATASDISFIIINPGALTHTSIALRDAFLGTDVAFIEVHLSNVYSRESFRHQSYLSDIAAGVIVGLGASGYELALSGAVKLLEEN